MVHDTGQVKVSLEGVRLEKVSAMKQLGAPKTYVGFQSWKAAQCAFANFGNSSGTEGEWRHES